MGALPTHITGCERLRELNSARWAVELRQGAAKGRGVGYGDRGVLAGT